MTELALITSNPRKAAEFAQLLDRHVEAVDVNLTEIQETDPLVLVERKALDAFARVGRPVIVDDTALAIDEWNGLPGALITWFIDSVGTEGLLDMSRSLARRDATVTAAIGYADERGVRTFVGALGGYLTETPRGTNGFGFDTIFEPHVGDGLTFAEMTAEQKNRCSHRNVAVNALRRGLAENSSFTWS